MVGRRVYRLALDRNLDPRLGLFVYGNDGGETQSPFRARRSK